MTSPAPDPAAVPPDLLETEDDRPSHLDFTDAELLELAQGTLQAVIVATAGHLRATGGDVDAWVAALADAFALGWDDPEPWTPGDLLDAVAVNLRALGAEIVAMDATGETAMARTRGFPDVELCGRLGVAVEDVLRYNDAVARVAAERGVVWSWRRDGDETVYGASVIPDAS